MDEPSRRRQAAERFGNEAKVYLSALNPSPAHRPEHRFVVVTRGRAGSTVLMALLDSNPAIDAEGEILTRRRALPRLYVSGRARLAARRSPSAEAYGFKVLNYQLSRVQRDGRLLQTLIPSLHDVGWRVIQLRRTNELRHALSNLRASQYGYHHRTGDGEPPTRVRVDVAATITWLRASHEAEREDAAILGGVDHLRLTYEEHLEDPAVHQHTANRVCDYLGVTMSPVETDLVRVAPRNLVDYVENYDELAEALVHTEFERFLDDPA